MVEPTIILNENFKRLLVCTSGSSATRIELIKGAISIFGINNKQAEGFVSRNIYLLKKKKLIESRGNKGEREYYFSECLQEFLKVEPKCNAFFDFELEERNINIEIKKLVAEIEAYKYYLYKSPSEKGVIEKILEASKEEYFELLGRINAIKKIIKETKGLSI